MKITLITNLNGTLIGLSFDSGKDITIGREIGNTIAPLSADGLSRHHARIYPKPDGWYVEDLGSTNGSYRMGQKLEGPVKLEQRDMLQFGKLEVSVDEFSLEQDAAPAPAAPAPAPAAAPAPAPAAKTELAPPSPLTPAEAANAAGAAAAVADSQSPTVLRRPTLPIRPGSPRPVLPSIRKPVVGGGLKPGLKMPPKPGLSPNLKLPPKPSLAPGLKLPPKAAVPSKGVVRVASNQTGASDPLTPVAELKPVDPSGPAVEMTPVE